MNLMQRDPRDPQDPNEAAEPNDANDPNEAKEPYIYAQPKDGAQKGFNLMGGEEDDEGEPVSPQEQAQYNDIVGAAMSMMYSSPEITKGIASKLKDDAQAKGGIANAIGQQTALIMLSVIRGLKKQGANPDPEVALNAGKEILAEVYEIAERTQQIPEGQEDQIKQDAMYEGTRFFGDQYQKAGEITPEMQAQARQAVEQDIGKQPQQQPPQQPPQPPQAPMQGQGAM